jgi:putative transcriptional regulator
MQGNLLILRKEKQYSQKQMADLLKISVKTYGLKERGDYPFDSDEMFKISNLFQMPMDKIFLPRKHQFGDKI